MRSRTPRGGTVFCAALFIFILTLSLFVGVLGRRSQKKAEVSLGFTYYFLVRDCSAATAGAVAGESYLAGGAGYLLEDGLVALACYYREEDAAAVMATMSERGVDVRLCERTAAAVLLGGELAGERARIEGNGRTVDAVSRTLYEAANGLERAELTQEEARVALCGGIDSLEGLVAENSAPCYALWNVELLRAARRGRELAEGILFAKDLRYLQIGLCVAVLGLGEVFA